MIESTVRIDQGAGSFRLFDHSVRRGGKVKVWYYMPANFNPDSQILFVMHGTKRNASEYRNSWIPAAERHNFLLVCPEFRKRDYPRETYHLANIVDRDRNPLPPEQWTFVLVEQAFDAVRQATGSRQNTYAIYGHSAGGQFVHRFVIFLPRARFSIAISANSGWYTMPDLVGDRFPYGLGGSIVPPHDLPFALQRHLVVLLGDADTDEQDTQLRKTRRAQRQGRNRYERGCCFIETAHERANELGVECNWSLVPVPGAGHLDREMMPAAARLLARHESIAWCGCAD